MTRLFAINVVLAISSIASAFTNPAPTSSSNAFSVRTRTQNSPLHMAFTSSFDSDWGDLPEEIPEGSSEVFEEYGLRDAPAAPQQQQATKFVTGDKVHELRRQILELRADLEVQKDNSRHVLELQRAIRMAQLSDAEFVYDISRERMKIAESRGRMEEVEQYHAEAMEARKALPQFNLEGLWVGKFGDHGYEMINITYVGDTIKAYKVTGDRNVPKGELSFSVDLSPTLESGEELLEPIELGAAAAQQWGAKFLSRFGGKGQVAAEGFVNPQFIEGQLILVNDFFSFAWVPLGHQVFFGRPSAELTLKLLRESQEGTSELDKARAHLNRCMEETEYHLEDDEHLAMVDNDTTNLSQEDFYNVDGYFE